MITDLIVLASVLFTVAFIAAWAVSPATRLRLSLIHI